MDIANTKLFHIKWNGKEEIFDFIPTGTYIEINEKNYLTSIEGLEILEELSPNDFKILKKIEINIEKD